MYLVFRNSTPVNAPWQTHVQLMEKCMKDSGDRLAAFNKKRRAGMTPEAKKVRVCDNSVDGQSVQTVMV